METADPAAQAAASDRGDDGLPDARQRRRLLIFLSVATFFEGFDILALTQILPSLQADFRLDDAEVGWLLGGINVGSILAFLLVRRADVVGRRPIMMTTIAGYTVLTGLSALATDVWQLGLCQSAARMFLIAEWVTSMVYAAESFPARQRATMIGIIQAFSSLGAVTCAAVVPLLLKTPLGWRAIYVAGVIPLVILAFARRDLPETPRFVAARARGGDLASRRLTAILRGPYARRVLQLALIWGLTYLGTHNAVTFWKQFAVLERGFTDAEVGMSVAIAAVAAMPLLFGVGPLLDAIGRRRGAVVIHGTAAVAIVLSYTLEGRWPLTVALAFGIFGASAVLPVLNAWTAELVPTAIRGDAFAWANNLLGRLGYVIGPVLVGQVAALGVGWGVAVAATAVFPTMALLLLLRWLPETGGAALDGEVADQR